jgi:hypothetical protein
MASSTTTSNSSVGGRTASHHPSASIDDVVQRWRPTNITRPQRTTSPFRTDGINLCTSTIARALSDSCVEGSTGSPRNPSRGSATGWSADLRGSRRAVRRPGPATLVRSRHLRKQTTRARGRRRPPRRTT